MIFAGQMEATQERAPEIGLRLGKPSLPRLGPPLELRQVVDRRFQRPSDRRNGHRGRLAQSVLEQALRVAIATLRLRVLPARIEHEGIAADDKTLIRRSVDLDVLPAFR